MNDLLKLAVALKDIKFTMLTTLSEDGNLYSRPMATLDIDERKFDGRIWFFTDINSPKVLNIKYDQHVNLSYGNPDDQKYISVVGRAKLVNDRQKMKDLWTPVMRAWFPEGIDDPQVGLICVEVESAELWDSPPSKVVQLTAGQHHIDVGGPH